MKKQSHVAKLFLDIAARWELSEDEQMKILGIGSAVNFQKFKSGQVKLSDGIIRKIFAVDAINEALKALLSEEGDFAGWIRKKQDCEMLCGKRPTDLICSGEWENLCLVRHGIARECGRRMDYEY